MHAFWNHSFCGKQLALLNKCCMFLQATTLVDIVDGTGSSIFLTILAGIRQHSNITKYYWPKQGPLSTNDWSLWRQALAVSFPTSTQRCLLNPLGSWTNTTTWKWFWSDQDSRLLERQLTSWRVWIPTRRSRHYAATFHTTDTFVPTLPVLAQAAIVIPHGITTHFWGARNVLEIPKVTRSDFTTFLQNLPGSQWALQKITTPDIGKGIAQAIQQQTAIAVSDGSFKDQMGSAAWTITIPQADTWIKGYTTIPGIGSDQCAYHSELGGIFSTVTMVNALCSYYSISRGAIQFGCDGLGPLQRCFDPWHDTPVAAPHSDLIKAIRAALAASPITWKWLHIRGHQDETVDRSQLDQWALLNIEMDTNAKAWLEHLLQTNYVPRSIFIPGEGWSCWVNGAKFTSLSRQHFNDVIQRRYSEAYWRQDSKAGKAFDFINWQACGDCRRSVSMTRRIWMTKWVTGWLPLGKNMKRWGFWTTDLCPECQQPESNPSHLFQCSAPECRQWLKNKICTLERTLLERKLSLQAVSLLLGVLFPQEFPRPTSSPEELIEIRHWQGVFNTLPTAWGFLHHSWTLVIQRCPPAATNFKHSPR